MEHNDKIKKAFWITEDMDREIDAHLKQDNCSSRSEFVMNALKFYVGYLNTKNASAFLPEVLSATLTGTLDGFTAERWPLSCQFYWPLSPEYAFGLWLPE